MARRPNLNIGFGTTGVQVKYSKLCFDFQLQYLFQWESESSWCIQGVNIYNFQKFLKDPKKTNKQLRKYRWFDKIDFDFWCNT